MPSFSFLDEITFWGNEKSIFCHHKQRSTYFYTDEKKRVGYTGTVRVLVKVGQDGLQRGRYTMCWDKCWVANGEFFQDSREKGLEGGESRLGNLSAVCIFLGFYHSSQHIGPGCSLALCSFLRLVWNPWVSAARIIALLKPY